MDRNEALFFQADNQTTGELFEESNKQFLKWPLKSQAILKIFWRMKDFSKKMLHDLGIPG